jgi:hypothetical protein
MKENELNAQASFRDSDFEGAGEAWLPSAAALGSYISAFRARMLLAVLGYCFALFAVALKSPKLGEILLVAAPALSLVIGLAMARSVLGFARLPREITGKAMARLSFALLLVSAAFSAYTLLLALPTVGLAVVPASLDAQAGGAFSAVWRLPWIDLASQIAMLVSLLALLASFAAVAGSIEATDMARRAARAFNVVALATGLAIALGYFEVRGSLRVEALVLAGIAVLVVALVGIAMTFGAARYLQVYVTNLGIKQRASEAPLPVLAWRNA